MDDFESRLSTMLHERAATVPATDRLDDVLFTPVTAAPSPRGRWWVGAAAAVLVVGAGVWALVGEDGEPSLRPTDVTHSTDVGAGGGWVELTAPPVEPSAGVTSVATGRGWFIWVEGDLERGYFYDVAVGLWTAVSAPGSVDAPGARLTAALAGDEVVVVLDTAEPTVLGLDPGTFVWREIPVSAEAKAAWSPIVGLKSYGERVIVWSQSAIPFRLMLLDPANGAWDVLPDAPGTDRWVSPPGEGLNMFRVEGIGRWIFEVASSRNTGAAPCAAAEVRGYDVDDGTWHSWTAPDAWSPSTVTSSGEGLLFAGATGCIDRKHVGAVSFDPATSAWATLGTGPTRSELAAPFAFAVAGSDGVAAVFVGSGGVPIGYDSANGGWWTGSAPPIEAKPVAAAVIGGDIYVWQPTPDSENGRVFRAALAAIATTTLAPTPT